uniref:Putative 30s ribosomal protein s12 n=1 Tax=Xenopsylla cheopis TaxID=163159 RepID=A0A6M2DGW0_XENCH
MATINHTVRKPPSTKIAKRNGPPEEPRTKKRGIQNQEQTTTKKKPKQAMRKEGKERAKNALEATADNAREGNNQKKNELSRTRREPGKHMQGVRNNTLRRTLEGTPVKDRKQTRAKQTVKKPKAEQPAAKERQTKAHEKQNKKLEVKTTPNEQQRIPTPQSHRMAKRKT